MAKRCVVLTPENFLSLTSMESVDVVTVEKLENMSNNIQVNFSGIDIMLQGKKMDIIKFESIDSVDNIGKFTIDTSGNILIFVEKGSIANQTDASMYIWGMVVIYELKDLVAADNIPTYLCESYNTEGYKISETTPSTLPDIMSKIKCLDNILDINETGYYYHIIHRNYQ